MRLLMHICCAPCAIYPSRLLGKRGISVTGFWYNPNIHPYTEYRSRLSSVASFSSDESLRVITKDEYGLVGFVRAIAGDERNRCGHCYETRLDETARTARREGFEVFTTSLMVSPYQDIESIRRIGEICGERHSVTFFDEDFRDGFRQGRTEARQAGYYLQKYCGCIYSEMERFHPEGRNSF